MVTFLKFVLAVVLVLAVLAGLGFWWLRSRFRRAIDDFSVASELLDPARLAPARIQLYRSDDRDDDAALSVLRERFQELGFQRMATFGDHGGAFASLLAMRHREAPVGAALVADHDSDASFAVFAVDGEHRVMGRSDGPWPTVADSRIDWQVDSLLGPEAAFAAVQRTVSESTQPIDLKRFRAAIEQVYAVSMDQKIVHRPRRETIVQTAVARGPDVTAEQIDQAHAIAIEHWKAQIEEAVLDRFRRDSKIDAVAWEAMRDELQVVHSRIDDEDVANFLVTDETSEQIYAQCREQGIQGIALYEEVARRLPADRRWRQVGTVDRPVRAVLYAPDQDIDSDAPAARQYVYDATGDNGTTVHGSVVAADSRDAKEQIQNLGLGNPRLLIEPGPGEDSVDEMLLDSDAAAIAARSVQESLGLSVLRSVVANWWIWAPPAGLVAKTFMDGPPLNWADYAGFAYAAVAALAMLFLIGPMVAYNQLLFAQLRVRPRQARLCLLVLETLNLFGGMRVSQIAAERCKVLAMEGRLDEALAGWSAERPRVSEEEYQAGLVSIYDAAGEFDRMMAAQRAFLEETLAKDTATVDLAMSMARYEDDADGPEALLQSVRPADLSEIGLIGYQYARGLVAAKRGHYEQALKHYAQSIDTASQFISVPVMLGLIAVINGYAALAFKQSGYEARAEELWEQVAPILRLHRSADKLIADWEAS